MSSQTVKSLTAEQRFRLAFERLKINEPEDLSKGTPVSQNNVAKEAGCDPSALRKSRFPSLVREIQAWVELHTEDFPSQRKALLKLRRARRSDRERMADAIRQRDEAVSRLASADRRIIELWEENVALKQRIDDLQPPPTPILKR